MVMNDKGKLFIKDMEKKLKDFNSISKTKFIKPKWGDSILQERIMRIGREAKFYELDVNDPNELQSIAVATLINDLPELK